MLMTEGVTKSGTDLWTVAEIGRELERIGADKSTEAPEAVEAAPTQSRLEQILMLLPRAFDAGKAGNWNANIHFSTSDQGTFSLLVAEGKCRVEKGASGKPSSTVRTDSETLLGMFDGSVDPQRAFMAGKLKIDKLGDMMKFQKAFDRSKVAAAAEQLETSPSSVAVSNAARETSKDPIERAFSLLPKAFRKEKASNWEANIHFRIEGAADYSVRVTGGECAAQEGLLGKPTSTVKTNAETLGGIFAGTTDPQKAFMARKFVVDNIGDMMKFARAFDFSALDAPAPAKEQPAATVASPTPKPVVVGANKEMIGTFYAGDVILADSSEMVAYAAAVGESNPAYLDDSIEGGIVSHPLFAVRYFHQLLMPAATDPALNLDLLRLVHGEQEMILHDAIRPKDVLYPTARLVSIEDKSSGQLVRLSQRLMREGRPVVEAVSGLFHPGKEEERLHCGQGLGRERTRRAGHRPSK